jgi:hypothetical protein
MLRINRIKKTSFYLSFLFSYLLFFALPFNLTFAGGDLRDTGQTKCYGNTGEIPCPAPGEPFYGQDGNLQGAQPAYQVSADGLVVTDLNTNLIWQQADDGVLLSQDDASSFCGYLSLDGHSDWRIPTVQELVGILDQGRYNPSINPAFSCRSETYWSGSPQATTPGGNGGWAVDFYQGNVFHPYKTMLYRVRCVRNGP